MTVHGAQLTEEHRINIAAGLLGIAADEYRERLAAGLKRCSGCHDWHPRGAFGVRATMRDGLDNSCRAANNARARVTMRRLAARRRAAGLNAKGQPRP